MGLRDAEAELAPYIIQKDGVRYLQAGRLRREDQALYMRLWRNGVPGTNGIDLICRHLELRKISDRPGPRKLGDDEFDEADFEAAQMKAAHLWITERLTEGMNFESIAGKLGVSSALLRQLYEQINRG